MTEIEVKDEAFIQSKQMVPMQAEAPIFPVDKKLEGQIKQKQDGSCYLLSSLYSIVKNRPERLNDIIRDNGNGTVTVTFYKSDNGIRTPVKITVDKSLPPVDSESAPWVRLIEKAFVASTLKMTAGKPPKYISYDNKKFDMNNLAWYRVEDFQTLINPLSGIKVSKDNEIQSQPDYESARKTFENIIFDAQDKKADIVISTKNHAMLFLGIEKINNKSVIHYYDQYKGKEYKVPVGKIFSSDTDIDSIDIAYPDENNKNNIQISLSPLNLIKELKKSSQTVSADSFKDIAGTCFLSLLEKYVKEYAPGEYKDGAMKTYSNIFTAGPNVNKFLKKKFAELNGKCINRELTELFAKPSEYRNEIISGFYNNLLLDVDEYKKSGKANDKNLNLKENSNIENALQVATKESFKDIVIECFDSFLKKAVSVPMDYSVDLPADPSEDSSDPLDYPSEEELDSNANPPALFSMDPSLVQSISDEVFSLGNGVKAYLKEFTDKVFAKYGDKLTNGEFRGLLSKPSKERSNMIDALSCNFFQDLNYLNNHPDIKGFKEKFPVDEKHDPAAKEMLYSSEVLEERATPYSNTMRKLASDGAEEMEEDNLHQPQNISNIKMSCFRKEFLRLADELKETNVFYSKGSKPYQNICTAIDSFKKELESLDDYAEFEDKFDCAVRNINKGIDEYRDLHKGMKLDDRMLTRLKIFNRMEMLGSRLHETEYTPGFAEKYAEKYIHAKLIDTVKNGKPDDAKLAVKLLMSKPDIDNRIEGISKAIKECVPASELDAMLMLKINGEKFMKALDKKLGKAAPSVLDSYEPEDVIARIETGAAVKTSLHI